MFLKGELMGIGSGIPIARFVNINIHCAKIDNQIPKLRLKWWKRMRVLLLFSPFVTPIVVKE